MERLFPITGVETINGKKYVRAKDLNRARSNEPLVPVYIPVALATRVLHDSPSIGLTSPGETTRVIGEPCLSKRNANRWARKQLTAFPYMSYDTGVDLSITFLKESNIPKGGKFQTFRYFLCETSLTAGYFGIANERYMVIDAVRKFAELVEQRLRGLKEGKVSLRELGDKLIGLVVRDDKRFMVELQRPDKSDGAHFVYSVFSSHGGYDNFDEELKAVGYAPTYKFSHNPRDSPIKRDTTEIIGFKPLEFKRVERISSLIKRLGNNLS